MKSMTRSFLPTLSSPLHRIVLLLSSVALTCFGGAPPVVFRVSEGVRPNSVVWIYGEYLTGSPQVRFCGADGSVLATQSAVQIDPDGHFCLLQSAQAQRDHLGWMIQSNSINVAVSSDWYDLSTRASGTNCSIIIDTTKTNVFFRLRYP